MIREGCAHVTVHHGNLINIMEYNNYNMLTKSLLIISVLISSYGASLAHRASYLALHSSLFGPVVQLIMIILSVTALTLS